MHSISIPMIGTDTAWRDAARRLLAARVKPDDVLWDFDGQAPQLFESTADLPAPRRAVKVSKDFVELANVVVWHKDPQRFARLYALLWRLKDTPGLMADRADPDLAKLRQMEKAVRRCQHKMKAFVRFRDLRSDGPRRSFGAWFEPTHHTMEPTAQFFVRRFGDMDWMIVTPTVTAKFTDGTLTLHPGDEKPELPEDGAEALWGTYFCNIFNPARVKISAMTSEMPKKYWKNMPETQFIPGLIADAEEKVRKMQDAGPTLPPERMAAIREQLKQSAQPASWNMLDADLNGCTRCPLHAPATQVVKGSGPRDAALMIVGEQPGDHEDMQGLPFVGPAGQLFRGLAAQAGLDPDAAYITNAVKHFKFKPTAKRRLHVNPTASEVDHCAWWLRSEVALVKPKLIIAMGASAARATTGNGKDITRRRGTVEVGTDGLPVFLTVHPSHLLRLPDADRASAEAAFIADLKTATGHLLQSAPSVMHITETIRAEGSDIAAE
ncbi:UdgX family uracil-DNA binding protein [Loktanella sp. F6476L]|uniref:UdgX family uracil-DNA binding protein n=1 Tax=Loktanella sp. F6476L TaxID=2926405 RepID=UPI001FF54D61|nr:UdgX family uracil-DNA binding protein [Loktanella sp. F6476L]MCK0122291.1 UdgX family uracil-DNA binding protein [Loktanella sp. F6476L]